MMLPNRWIKRNGSNWSARSPDLTVLKYFLRYYIINIYCLSNCTYDSGRYEDMKKQIDIYAKCIKANDILAINRLFRNKM